MSALERELDANHKAFLADWTGQAPKNWTALSSEPQFAASYRRLSCLNAIQHSLIQPLITAESAAFFLEAQNDALVSHVNANFGSWRTSLQSLRSCVENVLCALYYTDHPVELELWSRGQYRIWFSELHKYFLRHPRLSGIPEAVTGLPILKREYETLSKAVHGSAAGFRMTDGASKVLLWSVEKARLGKWAAREKSVLEAICSLIICFFASELQGARNPNLRAMLSYAVGASRRKGIKSAVKVTVAPP